MSAEANYDELLRMLDGYETVSQPREVPESILARARDAIRALQAENDELRERHECNTTIMHARTAALARADAENERLRGERDSLACVGDRIAQLRADLARVTAERDEARGTLAYVADRLNEEIRQECSGPQVQNYLAMDEFKAGLRLLGDRLVHRRQERDEARETLARMNRRCQSAESGLAHALEGSGERTLGRALANSAATMRAHEIEALRAQLAALAPRAEALKMLEKWLRNDTRRKVAGASCTFGEATIVLLCAECRAPSATEATLASAIRAAVERAGGS